jgi:pyruvate dehydrogenase kinase 2/3/4
MRKLHAQGALAGREEYITGYLNRFLMGRIGIRFVFNQHLSLFSEKHRMQDPSDVSASKIELGSRWVGSIGMMLANSFIRGMV